VRIQSERAVSDRTAAGDALHRAHDAIEATKIARAARESELASARIEHEWRGGPGPPPPRAPARAPAAPAAAPRRPTPPAPPHAPATAMRRGRCSCRPTDR